jgi:phosphoacetylglucosamine mutase
LHNGPALTTVLHVDCANGVGALKLMQMKEDLGRIGLSLVLYNTGDGELNYGCGADFVEKECKFPANMQNIENFTKCCSLDGDADRIVYFTKVDGQFRLINGDKIACLIAVYLNEHLSSNMKMSMGYIQTAYANGASTHYIENSLSNIEIVCTDTGVQYLHHEAKNYDIGIYFEANGHGTVLFKQGLPMNPQMTSISCLLSQYTGDAIGNMLFVETILRSYDFKEWIVMYHDLHTKQVKIATDKHAFTTVNFGRTCIKPIGLQESIDDIIGKYPNARAFVRPSGTEDIVRIYAECSNFEDIEALAAEVSNAIYTFVK